MDRGAGVTFNPQITVSTILLLIIAIELFLGRRGR